MLKKNVRKTLATILYLSVIVTAIVSIVFMERSFIKNPTNDKDYIYVLKNMLDLDIPVIGKNQTMLKPFTDPNVKVIKGFYNYLDDKQNQENALVYHEGTYIQNSGIDYGTSDVFDVIAVLDGTVIEVSESSLLGKTIQIRHNNEIISVYQSLSEVKVKKDDVVLRSQIIGKSGLSNILKDSGNHLHFELFDKGQVGNPLDYYDKKIE